MAGIGARLTPALIVLAVLGPLVVSACNDDAPAESPRVVAFDSLFVRSREVVPQQSSDTPIVRISGISFDTRSRFAIADVSEAHAQVFAADGSRVRVFGRRGEGPGEFLSPRYPYLRDETLYVGDVQLSRLTAYSLAADTPHVTLTLPDVEFLTGFHVLSDGSFLISGDFVSDSLHVLARYAPDGSLLNRMLPIRRTRPRGSAEAPFWNNTRRVSMQVVNDTAYITHTLSDSLWTVIPSTGEVTVERIPVGSGYVPPHLPAEPPRSPTQLMEWTRSFHVTSAPTVNNDIIGVTFVRGVLNYGDPNIFMVKVRSSDEWVGLENVPPPLTAYDSELVTLLNPLADSVVLGFFRLPGHAGR